MSKHAATIAMLDVIKTVLEQNRPMTVRQVYYQLVSRQIVENKRTMYQKVSDILVDARKDGTIPWDWIEDRLRRPRSVAMWGDLADFADTARRAYRRDVWSSQPGYVHVWLEKDALSGIFEDILSNYGVTLNVGRGYDGWDSIHTAAGRFGDGDGVTVLYFGDLDPSGEDMVRSLRERWGFFGCYPEVVKCALNPEDVTMYNLPPDFTKLTDTRRAGFVSKFGDLSVELDALPVDVLRARLVSEVEARLDLEALERVKRLETRDRAQLVRALSSL